MDITCDDLVVRPSCIDGVATRALMLAVDMAQADAAFLADIVVGPLAFHRRHVQRFRENPFGVFYICIARLLRPGKPFRTFFEAFDVIRRREKAWVRRQYKWLCDN